MGTYASLTRRFAIIAALSSAATAGDPLVLHVDDDAPPGGDGASWPTALADLQDALEIARVHVGEARIKIAAGVYTPDRGSGDRAAAFLLTGIALGSTPPLSDRPGLIEYEPETIVTCSAVHLTLEGGFAGLKMFKAPDTHDPVLYPTVLSGDLTGDDDLPGGSRDDNAYTVVEAIPRECDSITIKSVEISGGNSVGDEWEQEAGGGIFASGTASDPLVLEGCVIRNNHANNYGGGIYSEFLRLRLINTRFEANTSDYSGGGMFYHQISDSSRLLQIIGCDFVSNHARYGGGLQASNGDVIISDSRFTQNTAESGTGGASIGDASGFVTDSLFLMNESGRAGGLRVTAGDMFVSSCAFIGNVSDSDANGAAFDVFEPNITIQSCLFAGNTGNTSHGIWVTRSGPGCSIINCTFVNNDPGSAEPDAPVIHVSDSDTLLELRNSIVWGNAGAKASPMVQAAADFQGVVVVDHTLVQGGLDAFVFEGGPFSPYFFGELVADANPRFLDPDGPDNNPDTIDDNDYTPGRNSPAIDHARTDLLSLYPSPDAAGNERVVDLRTYAGHEALHTDIGAFESQDTLTPFCVNDFDTNPAPEYADILAFLVAFGAHGIEADLYRDAVFNIHDVLEFLEAFARGCE